jgi:hypothetical protein
MVTFDQISCGITQKLMASNGKHHANATGQPSQGTLALCRALLEQYGDG